MNVRTTAGTERECVAVCLYVLATCPRCLRLQHPPPPLRGQAVWFEQTETNDAPVNNTPQRLQQQLHRRTKRTEGISGAVRHRAYLIAFIWQWHSYGKMRDLPSNYRNTKGERWVASSPLPIIVYMHQPRHHTFLWHNVIEHLFYLAWTRMTECSISQWIIMYFLFLGF